MQGSKSLAWIFILLALSLISIRFGPFFLSTGEVGIQPNTKIFSGEKLAPATWIENRGIRYGVWDLRKETSNALIFTIVCMPEDGVLIKDAEISTRVLAVRLTLEMAKVVQWITNNPRMWTNL